MNKHSKVVIIGAGVFGLSTAHQLASEGFQNILVLDRHMPPAADGSSTDISRVVRFDYADEDYMKLAHVAYTKWRDTPKYRGIFSPAGFLLAGSKNSNGESWTDNTASQLNKRGIPFTKLDNVEAAKRTHPTLNGPLSGPTFDGYSHEQAGWVDASKAMTQLRDECIALGVSFLCGEQGTVKGLVRDGRKITAVKTLGGSLISGSHFILTAGAWSSGLVNMYKSTLATAQVLAYTRLTDAEVEKYKNLPIYANTTTGWFNFPPHEDTKMLKFAIHGYGYTREPSKEESTGLAIQTSSTPPLRIRQDRANFAPAEAEKRLRDGLREILPELGDRPFDKVAMCWYTDTPTGDFIMDFHPDYANLFVGGGCSGHAFKFLPTLGDLMSRSLQRQLPANLAAKWRFHTEYQNSSNAFAGDGSRAGPSLRSLSSKESQHLEQPTRAKL